MEPLHYHQGQIEVQQEANTRVVADKLASWVGPVVKYAVNADLLLFAVGEVGGELRFAALSGPPPMVEVSGPMKLQLCDAVTPILRPWAGQRIGALAISLAYAERARVNGRLLLQENGSLELETTELFTLCRKYIRATAASNDVPVSGPQSREAIHLADDWVRSVVGSAETTFLASVSPDGAPDVAHRGGPAGFLDLDAAGGALRWPEFVGDGVFKSAGNIRASGNASLLVPDLESGDALELAGKATYETVRFERRPRNAPLLQFRDSYPLQGRMTLRIEASYRLRGFTWPRQATGGKKVTSSSSVDDQAPV